MGADMGTNGTRFVFLAVAALGALVAACRPSAERDAQGTGAQAKDASAGPAGHQGEAAPGPGAAAKEAASPRKGATDKLTAKQVREKISALPEEAQVAKIVNPRSLAPYAGPSDTVRGIVRLSGDEPLVMEKALASMESSCTASQEVFRTTPRQGNGRALADAFVAVTGYDGFVPAREKAVTVLGQGCSWNRRTIGMTFGQDLRVKSNDKRPYVPELLGQPLPAQLFALPGGQPVSLPPRSPGQFRLLDSMRLYNLADVVVVPYATFDVTSLDGKFEIKGIPAGKARVDALLPATGEVAGKEIEVKPGEVTEVELTIAFDSTELKKTLDEVLLPEEARTNVPAAK